jgi:PAS domain S-box-containing protein
MISTASLSGKVDELLHTQVKDLHSPLLEEIQSLVDEIEHYRGELERENEELRKTRQHLEAYRARYVDLYDSAPLGYATLDQDGYLQEINLAGAKMLGADREALTGYSFREYVAEEDRQTFLDHIRRCVRDRRVVTAELRLVAKDGRSMAVQARSIPIEGPKEDTLCKTAITDITERRNMEEEIRRSRAFLQMVIDAIPDTMLVIDREYRILLANRAARDMNAGDDPAGSLTCHELSYHRNLPCQEQSESCPLRQVIATKAPATVLHTHYDAHDNEVFVEINAAPVFDQTGEVTSIIEVCRDITTRKRAEDALQRERTLLRTLIDNLPDYIYVKDVQGRFVAANLATARIMGASSPEELLGKTDHDFYPPELAAEYRADEQRLLRSGEPLLNKDEPHRDSDGNSRTILTTKVPLKDSQGKVVGLVGISRDITERKQVEELLRKVQQQVLEQQQ